MGVARNMNWLGEEDSNPCTVVQSHVSYRWTIPQKGTKRLASAPLDRQRGADLKCERSQKRNRAKSAIRTATSNPRQTSWIDSQCSPKIAPTHASPKDQM